MEKSSVQDLKLRIVDIDSVEPSSVSTIRKFQAKSWEADGGSPSHFSSSHPLIFFLKIYCPWPESEKERRGDVCSVSLSCVLRLNFSCLLRAPLFLLAF